MEGKIVIVHWDKSFEYLQCEGDLIAEQAATWITEFFGERCAEVDLNCEICKRWQAWDVLFRHV